MRQKAVGRKLVGLAAGLLPVAIFLQPTALMDPIRLTIALVPLALYLICLAAIHLRARPTIWNGAADNTYLAGALVGLVLVGPMDSLMPYSSPLPGYYLWLLMLLLYALGVTMWNLVARPRLVIFHATAEQVRAALEQLALRTEPEAAIAGNSFLLPQTGVHFHVDSYAALGTVSLVALGDQQSYSGWRRLRSELAQSLNATEAPRTMQGYIFAAMALVMFLGAIAPLHRVDYQAAKKQVREILRLPPQSDVG